MRWPGCRSAAAKRSSSVTPARLKTPALFEAFGRFVDSLGGRYITAEDVGTTTADMESVARTTSFVSGLSRKPGEAGGDPGPKTALGVYLGIKAAVKFRLNRSDLSGVGSRCKALVVWAITSVGCLPRKVHALRVADVRPVAVQRVCDEFEATAVPAENILSEDVEVFAPCALGAVLNAGSIPRLGARIVAGAANNQLAEDKDGQALQAAGVLYAPDYVINAGGIISVAQRVQRRHGGPGDG